MLRAVVGAGLYLAVVALLGVAVGTLIRSTAAALAAMVSVTLLIPAMSGLLPASWARLVGKFWPTVAGSQVMAVHHDPASALGPWAGFGLLCAFAAVVLTAALVAFRYRRDADD